MEAMLEENHVLQLASFELAGEVYGLDIPNLLRSNELPLLTAHAER